MSNIEIQTTVKIAIGDQTIVLSLSDAKLLKEKLDDIFHTKNIVHIDPNYMMNTPSKPTWKNPNSIWC